MNARSMFDGPEPPKPPKPPKKPPEPWGEPVPIGSGYGPDFPITSVPSPFREHIAAVAEAIQVPVALPAMLELGIVGACCAGKIEVPVSGGHTVPATVWTVVALESGERKSATFRRMMEPLRAWEAQRREERRHEVAQYHAQVRATKKALEKAEERFAKLGGDWNSPEAEEAKRLACELSDLEKNPIASPRVVADDITPEALDRLLAHQGGRILIASPEGGIFDLMSGKFNPNSTPTLDLLLKGYTGDAHDVDRVGRGEVHIPHPLISVALAIQNEVLRGLAARPGYRGRGVVGRFWYAVPESRVGYRDVGAPPVDGAVSDSRAQAIRSLLDLDVPDGPHLLRIDPRASERLRQSAALAEERLRPSGDLWAVADWGNRIEGGAARLSGILHMMKHAGHPRPWEEPVHRDTALAAWGLMDEFLIPHATLAIKSMGGDAHQTLAQHALGWVRRKKVTTFRRTDLHRDLDARVQRPSDWDGPLDLLCEANYLRKLPAPEHVTGRLPGQGYEVNPKVFESSAGGKP